MHYKGLAFNPPSGGAIYIFNFKSENRFWFKFKNASPIRLADTLTTLSLEFSIIEMAEYPGKPHLGGSTTTALLVKSLTEGDLAAIRMDSDIEEIFEYFDAETDSSVLAKFYGVDVSWKEEEF